MQQPPGYPPGGGPPQQGWGGPQQPQQPQQGQQPASPAQYAQPTAPQAPAGQPQPYGQQQPAAGQQQWAQQAQAGQHPGQPGQQQQPAAGQQQWQQPGAPGANPAMGAPPMPMGAPMGQPNFGSAAAPATSSGGGELKTALGALAIGILMFLVAGYMWWDLTQLEDYGGSRSVHWVIALVYNIAGKWGVVGVLSLVGLGSLGFSAYNFIAKIAKS